jgi:DNA-binding transcriptional ArsR family regulator
VEFLTNHARVLLCVARDPDIRLREIAECVGVTERSAHKLVGELEAEGYLKRRRVGRRNAYELAPDRPLGDDVGVSQHEVGELLALLLREPGTSRLRFAVRDGDGRRAPRPERRGAGTGARGA